MEASTRRTRRPEGSGWFTFAGVMLIISGVANLLWGIGALDKKEYLPENGLLFSNLSFWGWLSIIWAVVALIGAFLLLTRSPAGVVIGVSLATVSAVFWLFALPVLPIWALTIIAINVLIIHGLITHAEIAER